MATGDGCRQMPLSAGKPTRRRGVGRATYRAPPRPSGFIISSRTISARWFGYGHPYLLPSSAGLGWEVTESSRSWSIAGLTGQSAPRIAPSVIHLLE